MGIEAPLRRGETTSADGTRIAYYVAGRGPRVWLMPPAMGAPLLAAKPLVERFADDLTIVTWDMRGFHRSGVPRERDAYTVGHHLDDLEAVCRAEKLERFVMGGWSMGVQLSLERYHRRSDDVEALILINGPYEQALNDAFHPTLGPAVARGLSAMHPIAPVANAISRRLPPSAVTSFMARAGLLARATPLMAEVVSHFRQVHWGRYATVIQELHAHSAGAYLGKVEVPTLITAGGNDPMTPLAVAERMHAAIGGSELFVIDEGTHYMPLEFPEALADRIASFLGERVGEA